MTLREAIDARLPAVRLPEWCGATLAFHYTPDDHVGPWVTLADPNTATAHQLLITEVLRDDRTDWAAAPSDTRY